MIGFSLAPQHLISTFGLLGIAGIVFAESGLLVGFFLPGDSLLFTAGAAAAGALNAVSISFNIWTLLLVVIIAAVVGDQVGYLVGARLGSRLFDRPDSRWFKQAHHERSAEFFDRHGPKALVLARFVPVVRTFVPVIAGASPMDYRRFAQFNLVGGVLWGASVTMVGYWFGQVQVVRDHLELTILAVVALSLVPVIVEVARSRRRSNRGRTSS